MIFNYYLNSFLAWKLFFNVLGGKIYNVVKIVCQLRMNEPSTIMWIKYMSVS